MSGSPRFDAPPGYPGSTRVVLFPVVCRQNGEDTPYSILGLRESKRLLPRVAGCRVWLFEGKLTQASLERVGMKIIVSWLAWGMLFAPILIESTQGKYIPIDLVSPESGVFPRRM